MLRGVEHELTLRIILEAPPPKPLSKKSPLRENATLFLIGMLGVSPRTLHAAVSAGGETFAAMVRRRRLERAAALLADAGSRATITEIAASVGFDGSSSFARAFRREFGRAPTDVRRAARGARDGQSMRTD